MRPPDADDLSHITQQPGESARKFWNRFLTKKNQIVDCPDAEALAAFKHNICDEWLARHLGQEKPKAMAALMTLMTRFCAGEDSWLARSNIVSSKLGTFEPRDNNGKPRGSKHKRRKGCHGLRHLLAEVSGKPLITDLMIRGRWGFGIRTVADLVLCS